MFSLYYQQTWTNALVFALRFDVSQIYVMDSYVTKNCFVCLSVFSLVVKTRRPKIQDKRTQEKSLKYETVGNSKSEKGERQKCYED